MATKALLIVDMQAGSFTPATPRYESEKVIEKINQLASFFRLKGNLVIFIRHDGTNEGYFLPGSEHWQIIPELIQLPGDIYVEKTINDSFYHSRLESTLRESGINELYFVGCATDFCVDATIKSALGKDFDVTVVKDAHTTADRPFVSAKNLIDHHNWLWSELTPAAFPLKLIPTREIIENLKD